MPAIPFREISIGRSRDCDIYLDDRCIYASSNHGIIFSDGNQLVYRDTSSNGTLVNNMMVKRCEVPINRGDVILIAGSYPISWQMIDRFFAPTQFQQQQYKGTVMMEYKEQVPVNNKSNKWKWWVLAVIILVLLLSFIPLVANSQSIIWQLKPSDYTSITRFGPNLYQVTKGGRKGLIQSNGDVVVPLGYDLITDFYEHKALVLKNEDGKERVLGVLTDEGQYISFSGSFYTLAGQGFYSDGMLSVADAKGLPGYLNERGVAVLGFNGSWDRIKPFTEGYAAVFKNKKYMLIDKEGHKANFIIGIGEVYGGRNVYKGKAYIYDDNGKFYTYDVSTRQCKPCKAPTKSQQSDYLYCFTEVTGRGKTPQYSKLSVGQTGLMPVQNGDLYGYREADKILLPAQFTSATPFVDNLAVVNLQGQYGILKLVEDRSYFSISVPNSHFEYSPGSGVDCVFQLSTPSAWKPKDVVVTLVDSESNKEVTITYASGDYTFHLNPQTTEKKYELSVSAEGLNLWNGHVSYTFKKKEEHLRVQLTMNTHRANENDRVPVVATITNAGDDEVTTTITMTGSAAFNRVTRTETIAAGKSIQISSYFVVKKDLTDQHVSVSTSKGGYASKTGLSLSAFY